MMRRGLFILLAMTFVPLSALAAEIVMNGVEMDIIDLKQLAGKKFRDCTVYIDSEGKLYIEIPGIKIMKVAPDEAEKIKQQEAKQKPDENYYLASDITSSANTGYLINIYINGKLIKQIQPGERRIIMRINKYLHKGKNSVRFVAHKAKPGSGNASDKLSLTVGVGRYEQGAFIMERPMVLFEVNAAMTKEVERKFELEIE